MMNIAKSKLVGLSTHLEFGKYCPLKEFGTRYSPSTIFPACYKTSASINAQKEAASQVVPGEDFFKKNERLSRPLSPHLTIYKPQLTSMLSITHRGTGVMMSCMLSGFGIGMMCLPASFPYYIGLLSSTHYGAALMFGAKFCVAFPFSFHVFNGIRHLAWDMGYGFSLRSLYTSGYAVVALASLAAAILANI